ncbi:microtubule-associated protein 2 isoform X2 [Daktulosphaira vitifoliae]|uniref:microtubule-associated protein 2 isoform X2 n=1 Tax=Daktulosphaira vitifoliae TaxID=58002 RepID=UPI0021AA7983|nr:microtubule-associated protein 2 isoform X2 [Daktulosphaira vitifoliae]
MDNNRRNSIVEPGGSFTTRMQLNMTTTLPPNQSQQRPPDFNPRTRPEYYPPQKQGPYPAQPFPPPLAQNRFTPPNSQRPPSGPQRPPGDIRPINRWNAVRQVLPSDGSRGGPLLPQQRPPFYNMQPQQQLQQQQQQQQIQQQQQQQHIQQQQQKSLPPHTQEQYKQPPPPPPIDRRPTLSRIDDKPPHRLPENDKQKVVDDDNDHVITTSNPPGPVPILNRRDSSAKLLVQAEVDQSTRQWQKPVQEPPFFKPPQEQSNRQAIIDVQERYNERPEPQNFQSVNYNRQDDHRPNLQNGPQRDYRRRDSVLEQPRVDIMRRNDSVESDKFTESKTDIVKRTDYYRKPSEPEELRRSDYRRPEVEENKRSGYRRPSVQDLDIKRSEYRRPDLDDSKLSDYRRPSEQDLDNKRTDFRRPEPILSRVDSIGSSPQDRLSRNLDLKSYAPERKFSLERPIESYNPNRDVISKDLRKSNFEATYLKTVKEIDKLDDKYASSISRPLLTTERSDERNKFDDRKSTIDSRGIGEQRLDERKQYNRVIESGRINDQNYMKYKEPTSDSQSKNQVKDKDKLEDHMSKNLRPDTLKIIKDHEPLKDSSNSKRTDGDACKSPSKIPKKEKSELKTPTRAITPKTPDSVTSIGQKKLSMNKIQVGSAPSPNLKVVQSKIGSLQNTSYKPGGGQVKIESRKLEWKAGTRIQAKNDAYVPGGGDKKIQSVKLQWNAKPKVGSLENKTHKPGGGDKKIETVKLDFKDKAKPKIGSKDNIKHTPGGGSVKIEDQKIEIKAQSKVGSLENVKHKPGGGEIKIFDDKSYIKQAATGTPTKSQLRRSSSMRVYRSEDRPKSHVRIVVTPTNEENKNFKTVNAPKEILKRSASQGFQSSNNNIVIPEEVVSANNAR